MSKIRSIEYIFDLWFGWCLLHFKRTFCINLILTQVDGLKTNFSGWLVLCIGMLYFAF